MDTTKTAAPLTYEERIQESVTFDERAAHRNLLGVLGPVLRGIEEIERNMSLTVAFSSDERALLEQARRLLQRKRVPMALVAEPQEEASPFLFDR